MVLLALLACRDVYMRQQWLGRGSAVEKGAKHRSTCTLAMGARDGTAGRSVGSPGRQPSGTRPGPLAGGDCGDGDGWGERFRRAVAATVPLMSFQPRELPELEQQSGSVLSWCSRPGASPPRV